MVGLHKLRVPLATLLLFVMALTGPLLAQGSPTVGVPEWKRDLVLAGSELEVKPATPAAPIVLRIDDVRPHGSDLRYDIEYYGLEPGSFDLRDYLRRKDGSALDGLDPIEVQITSVLAPGIVEPNALAGGELPNVGGYQTRAWLLGILWVVGLWVIISLKRKRTEARATDERPAQTLADRLRPLVEEGLAGRLSREASAQLEMTLIALWRRRLSLQNQTSAQALEYLRGHDEAGPLLRQLELWLHSPGTANEVNITELLAPYQRLAPEDLEMTDTHQAQRTEAEYA